MTAPRLHVIPAVACDKALILRRGPTNQVASILWDRASGEFQLGQWLKGRIYEYRSDLSPDGRHMVYFAGPGENGFWTALSRAPWLTALAFLSHNNTWAGGGAFTHDGRIWLTGGRVFPDGAPDGLQKADISANSRSADRFPMGNWLYPTMMALRGWRHIGGEGYESRLEKPLADGWRMELGFEIGRKNRSIISNRYVLLRDGDAIETLDWEWAEPWEDGVQFAARGALQFAPLTANGLGAPTLIRDFSDMEFEARRAPYASSAEFGATG